jgi:hypothetical protein
MAKLVLLAIATLGLSAAAEAPDTPAISRFSCPDGPNLTAHFGMRGAAFGAIVDAGDGPHFLPARPFTQSPVKLIWSDGRRTLTWSPGVLITWADGGAPKTCGRQGGHNHSPPVRGEGPARAT